MSNFRGTWHDSSRGQNSQSVGLKVRRPSVNCKNTVMRQIMRKYKRPIHVYSRANRYRLKVTITEDCTKALEFLKCCGTKAEKLIVRNVETGVLLNITFSQSGGHSQQVSNLDYIKDKFGISDQACQAFTSVCDGLPYIN